MIKVIYLDNNATTKIDPVVLEAMLPYLGEQYGNPGSIYQLGRKSRDAIDLARKQVASFVNAEPEQVIFTSSGTEANNLAFYSQVFRLMNVEKNEAIISSVEHESILKTVKHLTDDCCFYATLVNPDYRGRIDADVVYKAINDRTGLVSVMMVNNEVGTRNPVEEIAKLCNSYNILFHTDCVQAASSERLDFKGLGCNMMSISSHKIHGPKGVGALISNVPLNPMICGGAGQEFGIRAGTENVAGIVGFGKACELMHNNIEDIREYTSKLKYSFCRALHEQLDQIGLLGCVRVNGLFPQTLGKTINLGFNGVDGETLVLLLDKRGVCVSAGAACSSLESTPSHVLLAMGIDADMARNSIRVSFSKDNTYGEALEAAKIIASCVETILKMK